MKLIFTLLKQTLFTTSLALSQYICGRKIFVGLSLIGSYRSRCTDYRIYLYSLSSFTRIHHLSQQA